MHPSWERGSGLQNQLVTWTREVPASCAKGRWLGGCFQEMWARWVLPLTAAEALRQLPKGVSWGRKHLYLPMSKARATGGHGLWPVTALSPAPCPHLDLPSPHSLS